jgi:hypothetical protein
MAMMIRTLTTSLLLATSAVAEDRALVVGINDYSALEGGFALGGAAQDASRMADYLQATMSFPQGAITVLTDGAATSDAILSTLIDKIVRETDATDRVFVYFAGLGTTLDDGTPALVAFDGNTVLGQIPLTTITEIVGVISDRDVTIMLDASFDGGPIGARGLPGAMASMLQLETDATIWSAAKADQYAWEQLDRGVFTSAFVQAIDVNRDGALTNAEVLKQVTEALATWCDQHAQCTASGRGWEPVFSGSLDDVVFRRSVPEPKPEVTEPIVLDDGAPASLRETLGFVTDLFAPSNDAQLSLSIAGGDALQIGEFVTFTASADRPGTLLLLDVDPTGQLAQVYPSRLVAEGDTRVTPGQPLTIPSALGANGRPLRIRVTEPAGQGLLLGLFIEGDLPQLTALMPAGIAGGPVPNAGQSLFEISQKLLRLESDPDRPVAWSATYLPYRIER